MASLARFADRHFAALLIAPGILWMLALLVYPVALNFYYSFTDKSFQYPSTEFVGWENYLAFLSDPAFWDATINSITWTVTSVFGQMAVGFVCALSVEAIARGRALVRLILIVPWTFSSIVLASVWRLMLDELAGVINAALVAVGVIDHPIAFFGNASYALGAAVVMNVWFGAPFMFLAFLAGMQTVPHELYEAAVTDGAGYWRQVWHVMAPALRPVLGTLVLLRTIWVMNNFDFIYLTTGGGPSDSTLTLPVYAFRLGWGQFEVGRMAAVSVGMTIALLLLAVVLFRLMPIAEDERN